MRSFRFRHLILVPCILLLPTACDSQSDRPLNYDKGKYLGEPHTPLDDATLQALRSRAAYQSGPGSGPLAGGGLPSAVRPPSDNATPHDDDAATAGVATAGSRSATGASDASLDTLRRRARRQGGY